MAGGRGSAVTEEDQEEAQESFGDRSAGDPATEEAPAHRGPHEQVPGSPHTRVEEEAEEFSSHPAGAAAQRIIALDQEQQNEVAAILDWAKDDIRFSQQRLEEMSTLAAEYPLTKSEPALEEARRAIEGGEV